MVLLCLSLHEFASVVVLGVVAGYYQGLVLRWLVATQVCDLVPVFLLCVLCGLLLTAARSIWMPIRRCSTTTKIQMRVPAV